MRISRGRAGLRGAAPRPRVTPPAVQRRGARCRRAGEIPRVPRARFPFRSAARNAAFPPPPAPGTGAPGAVSDFPPRELKAPERRGRCRGGPRPAGPPPPAAPRRSLSRPGSPPAGSAAPGLREGAGGPGLAAGAGGRPERSRVPTAGGGGPGSAVRNSAAPPRGRGGDSRGRAGGPGAGGPAQVPASLGTKGTLSRHLSPPRPANFSGRLGPLPPAPPLRETSSRTPTAAAARRRRDPGAAHARAQAAAAAARG